jgi:signal peptidase
MRRAVTKVWSAWLTLVAIGVLAIAILLLAMPLLGFQTYVITGGSMTGAINRGAVIFDKTVPVASLKVGDIITFRPPDETVPVTHRIISIVLQQDGTPVFSTKGDFNEVADPWHINLDRPVQARYVAQIAYLGYVLAVLGLPIVRLLLLALPAFVIALSLLYSLWKEAGEEVRRREAAADFPSGPQMVPPQHSRCSPGRR